MDKVREIGGSESTACRTLSNLEDDGETFVDLAALTPAFLKVIRQSLGKVCPKKASKVNGPNTDA